MHVGGIGKLSFKEMEPHWEPFFSQFSIEVSKDEKEKIMRTIVESSCRMIARMLKKQKELYKV